VIPKFVRAVIEGRRPIVFGDGEQSRDFTYVQNVVEANLLACSAGPDAPGEVINVACGERITLNALAAAIQDALGKQVGVEYAAPRPGDVKHSLADVAKARRLLGYNPGMSFREGLERTVAWYTAG
jgi:UDP-glucose 4-epimerase